MKTFAKHLLGCVTMAIILVLIFGMLVPMLVSAPSTFLATLGFAVAIGVAIGSALLVKHVLTFDYHKHIKK
jgi:hypothetical protein